MEPAKEHAKIAYVVDIGKRVVFVSCAELWCGNSTGCSTCVVLFLFLAQSVLEI